ncbi:MAG: choice-of-anchor J domain-containing protein [Bacteroidales bacterium]|nr:choice-of-anchor J domain-containing protein [Bacteroidales bacterium]
MRKFYLLMVLVSAINFVFAQSQRANFETQKTKVLKNVFLTPKATIDTNLTNILDSDTLTVYTWQSQWGYLSGHNGYNMNKFAERFYNSFTGTLNGVAIYIYKAKNISGNATLNLKVYADGNTPGNVIYSQNIPYSQIQEDSLNIFLFSTPVNINGNFYIGYELSYGPPVDTFCVVMAQFGNPDRTVNTAYLMYNNTWYSISNLLSGSPKSAYCMIAICSLNVPDNPVASVTPTSWDAGSVVVGNSATSPSFILKNNGGGTLTVSSISGLTGTPFTCSLNPANVNLHTGESVQFTFTYSPTAVGSHTATCTLATNGGNVTINLSGTAISGCTITQFPWEESFEGNFPPACWTKYSPDGGTGWAKITAGTSPLPGWVGGTMSVPSDPSAGNAAAYCTWNTGGSTYNDQWLVTPQFTLTQGLFFRFYIFWFGAYQDRIDIKLSTTGNQPSNFTTTLLSLDTTQLIHNAWKPYAINLNQYAGQNVYFAFHEHVADNYNDGAFLAIDVVRIDNQGNVADVDVDNLISVFPNPATDKLYIAAQNLKSVELININGKVVATFNKNIINLNNIDNGIYYVKVTTKSTTKVYKVNILR